jgi:1-acyl-sn-glycerol-3-phosphate acyltransferase
VNALLRQLFFWLVVRPVVTVGLGLNVRHRERLPRQGPAILAANHNSHLDTVTLMMLLKPRLLARTRPVAAADYFLKNRLIAWFSQKIIGIIPIERGGRMEGRDPLAPASRALGEGAVLVIFPEGTRGEPERFKEWKSGVAHLAKRHPQVPVIPVYMHGLGKTLPKGAFIPVPFFLDVFVGEPLHGEADHKAFMARYVASMTALKAEGGFPEWE